MRALVRVGRISKKENLLKRWNRVEVRGYLGYAI
jgi:hypothetical protein